VQDPEIPVISVIDLGVIRHLRAGADGGLEVGLTPTYSGCPAAAVIRVSVIAALRGAGFADVRVVDVLNPPWSSADLSAEARRRLERYGIAPPVTPVSSPRQLWRTAAAAVACPRCASTDTSETSAFGSTPCKALYRCNSCREPFEYFKCI
jgi:ring-1,2-phenylacetyl-CoA epoxidase subunit PaaD